MDNPSNVSKKQDNRDDLEGLQGRSLAVRHAEIIHSDQGDSLYIEAEGGVKQIIPFVDGKIYITATDYITPESVITFTRDNGEQTEAKTFRSEVTKLTNPVTSESESENTSES